jgi:5-methylcytosine-specific restriction protein A
VPYKPPSPCAYPGCPKLTSGRYCTEHQKQVNSHYNHFQREPETSKRYGAAWRRIRDRYIKEHPLCELCKKEGRLVPAEIVYHVLPLSEGGTNDTRNLMSLCESHHSSIHLSERNKKRGE